MKKEIGTVGFLTTSFGLTVVAVIMIFIFPYTLIQIAIMFIAVVFGLSALVKSIKEKTTSRTIASIFAICIPIVIFLGLTYLLNQDAKRTEQDVQKTLDYYKKLYPDVPIKQQ